MDKQAKDMAISRSIIRNKKCLWRKWVKPIKTLIPDISRRRHWPVMAAPIFAAKASFYNSGPVSMKGSPFYNPLQSIICKLRIIASNYR